jgi:ribosome maturation factor RimP
MALREVIEPVVSAYHLELDDLTVVKAGARRVVRVTVDGDGPQGRGPSLDDIAAASSAISHALDDSAVTGNQPYVLEVSSRGVDRPLTRPAHWRRNRGRLVAVTRLEGEALLGRVGAADQTAVQLDVAGSLVELPYAVIAKAVVQVELNRLAEDFDEAVPSASEEASHGH